MKKKNFILGLIIVISAIGIYIGFNKSYSASNDNLDIKRKVLVETMDAFYRKGKQLQYDTYRKNYYLTPEMITNDKHSFSVCSSFVQSVYKNAFDVNVLSVTAYMGRYAYFNSKNEYYEYVPFSYYKGYGYYLNGKNINSELDYSKFEKTLVNLLLPGDIFLLNNDSPISGGHTMMVYSVDKTNNKITLIHSNGKNKENIDTLKEEFDKIGRTSFYNKYKDIRIMFDDIAEDEYFETAGAIQKIDLVSYLKNRYTSYKYLAVIRPLGNNGDKFYEADTPTKTPAYDSSTKIPTEDLTGYEYKNLNITPNGQMRNLYSNIDITKTGSHHDNSNVDLNDTITYTVKIKNNSNNKYTGLNIKETLPNYVSLRIINDNGKQSGNSIIWENISVNANSEKSVSYTVKVINNEQNYGKNIISKGIVYNQNASLSTSTVTNVINKTLSVTQNEKLEKSINDLKKDYGNINYGIDFVNAAYKNAFGVDLKLTGLKRADFIKTNQKINENDYEFSVKDEYKDLVLNDFINCMQRNNFYRNSRNGAGYLNAIEDKYNQISDKYMKKLHYNNLNYGDFIYVESWALDVKSSEAVKRWYYTVYLCLGDKYLKLETYIENSKKVFTIKEITDKNILNNLFTALYYKSYYFVFSPGQIIGDPIIPDKKVTSISISKLPTKLTYIQNKEKLDLTGGKLKINYNNGTNEIISLDNKSVLVSGFDNTKIGNNTLKVKYNTFTAEFVVKIIKQTVNNNENTNIEDNNNNENINIDDNINNENTNIDDNDNNENNNIENNNPSNNETKPSSNVSTTSFSHMYIVLIVIGILVVFSVLFVDNKK